MDRPPREEYVLTAAGLDLLPVLVTIGEWGRKHRSDGDVTRLIDEETGKDIRPIVVDEVTGAKLGTKPIQFKLPG